MACLVLTSLNEEELLKLLSEKDFDCPKRSWSIQNYCRQVFIMFFASFSFSCRLYLRFTVKQNMIQFSVAR